MEGKQQTFIPVKAFYKVKVLHLFLHEYSNEEDFRAH